MSCEVEGSESAINGESSHLRRCAIFEPILLLFEELLERVCVRVGEGLCIEVPDIGVELWLFCQSPFG